MGAQVHRGVRKPHGFWNSPEVLATIAAFVAGRISRAKAYEQLEITHYGEPMAAKTLDWYTRKYLRESGAGYGLAVGRTTERVTVTGGDRLMIPESYLETLSLRSGDEVIVQVEDGELRIIAPLQALRKAQELVREHVPASRSLADELITERRQET